MPYSPLSVSYICTLPEDTKHPKVHTVFLLNYVGGCEQSHRRLQQKSIQANSKYKKIKSSGKLENFCITWCFLKQLK